MKRTNWLSYLRKFEQIGSFEKIFARKTGELSHHELPDFLKAAEQRLGELLNREKLVP